MLKSYNVHGDPEVNIIPNFLDDEEISHLLRLAERGWEPSEASLGRSPRGSNQVGSGVYRSKEEGKDLVNASGFGFKDL